jgi:hypothetical protein
MLIIIINNLFAKKILLTILHITIHSFQDFLDTADFSFINFFSQFISLYLAIVPIYFKTTSLFLTLLILRFSSANLRSTHEK